MTLSPGARLGPYEILSGLGAGGMGEVYRARDTKLNRDVAIKVLLPSVANDPDRLARFSREAQVLASLNHPNIAAIYGLEDADVDGPADAGRHVRALVLEVVEGDTLADRVAESRRRRAGHGSAAVRRESTGVGGLPIADALGIARQIAQALEAAHAANVVHRDLKPANIKIRPDGMVKVLDFGLALALTPAVSSSDLSNAATMASPAMMTHPGVVLGTAAYMSPEQARGAPVDRRADVWAFGCVLYEMLTGRTAFGADTVSESLARVLEREPDWKALPRAVPERVRALLRRCLQKDPVQRLHDIADARIELEDLLAPRASAPLAALVRKFAGVAIALLLVAAAVVGAFVWLQPAGRSLPTGHSGFN